MMWKNLVGALRLAIFTVLGCCVVYPAVIWLVGQLFTPDTANGSLIRNNAGVVVGSRQVAQKFTRAEYFHCRPSAVDYNAAASGGSNLSPCSPKLRARAEKLITQYHGSAQNPVPADLVTASGSGLDPHITFSGAKFQLARVAQARQIPAEKICKLLEESVIYPGGFITREPLINVLEINLKLDALQ